jgi:5-(carboxyamino)imidazole ribonucleotide synthase
MKDVKLGILGGGQLGRMLLQSALDLNLYTLVLDPDPDAPCRHFAHEFVEGSFADYETVLAFGRKCTVLTVEIEHVNCDALDKLAKEGIQVSPSPKVLRIVQDKGLQKEFYSKHGIPTADYHLISKRSDLAEFADFLPAFQKLRTSGYDGKGVVRLTDSSSFIDDAFDAPSVLESKIEFDKEIAVICARNKLGEVEVYDPVEMVFHPEANLVDYLFAPANLTQDITDRALTLAVEVAQKLRVVGLLAVEMFVTKDEILLVNEVAPRPHNSGHHSMRACRTSQFEQHLRAILELPLGVPDLTTPAVLVNLLGEEGHTGPAVYEGLPDALQVPGVYVHLYGKALTKPFRKMGHAIILDEDLNTAFEKAVFIKETLRVTA